MAPDGLRVHRSTACTSLTSSPPIPGLAWTPTGETTRPPAPVDTLAASDDVGDERSAPVTLTKADLIDLPELTPDLRVQPPGRQALVNRPVIVHTPSKETSFAATIRDAELTVQATPTAYSWDFTDTTITTAQPGAPYPDHTIHHTYRTAGPRTLTLQITWRIAYRAQPGGGWRELPETVTTNSQGHAIELIALDNYLTTP